MSDYQLCTFCNHPCKVSGNGVSLHLKKCPKKNMLSRETSWAIPVASSLVPQTATASSVTNPTTAAALERRSDAMKSDGHEEALGYDNTLLLSVSSLGESAKKAANFKKKDSNANVTEYGGLSDDESEDIDDGKVIGAEGTSSSTGIDNDDDEDDEDYVPDIPTEFQDLQHNEVSFTQNDDAFTSTPKSYVHGAESEMDDPWVAHRDRYNNKSNELPPHKPYEQPPPLEPVLQSYTDLLHRLKKHVVSNKVFDEVVDWAYESTRRHPDIFRNMSRKTKRPTVINRLRRELKMESLSPTMTTVRLPSGKIVTMPVFCFKKQVEAMLHDETLFNERNMCQHNFKCDDWTQLVPITDLFSGPSQKQTELVSEARELQTINNQEELSQHVPPSPTQMKDMKIDMLYEWTVEGQKVMHWCTGTIDKVVSSSLRNATVRVTWEHTRLTKRKSTSTITLLYDKWHKTEHSGWRPHDGRSGECVKPPPADGDPRIPERELDVPVDDVYTGSMMTLGIRRFLGSHLPPGIHKVRPLPIIFFIDKSHSNMFGSLATTPISFTVASLRIEVRRQSRAWRNLGFIPPLNVGLGRNANALDIESYIQDVQRRQQGDKKEASSVTKLRDLHALLEVALQSFHDACKTGIVVQHKNNIVALYRPFILMVIGDTAGNNELSCHYNNSGNASTPCLNYSCQCGFEDLANPNARCKPILASDIAQSERDPVFAKTISQHPVTSAFSKLALPDKEGGLPAALPKEPLHVNLQGNYVAGSQVIHDLIGEKGKNAKHKDRIDQLHQRVSIDLRRNSERNYPRSSNRFGFMDLTRLTGSERLGNLFIFVICLYTHQGMQIMGPFLDAANIPISKFVYTICLLMSYDVWTQGRMIDRQELVDAEPVVRELMHCILKYLPKEVVKKGDVKMPESEGPNMDDNHQVSDNNSTTKQDQSRSVKTKRKADDNQEPGKTTKKSKKDKSTKDKTKEKQAKRKVEDNQEPGKATKKSKKDKSTKDKTTEKQGSNGWHTVKFHALLSFIRNMCRFGSATNFDGGPGEEHHKDFVKKTGHNTQRRPSSFTAQVGLRHEEANIVDRAYQLTFATSHTNDTNADEATSTDSFRCRGKYVLEVTSTSGGKQASRKYSFKTMWADYKKTNIAGQFQHHPLLQHAIARNIEASRFNRDVAIIGYTEITLKGTTYHSSPNHRGYSWYDWALINFPKSEVTNSDDSDEMLQTEYLCIGKILGFIEFHTPGYPTFRLHKEETHSLGTISGQKMVDNDMYMVVDCSTAFLDREELETNIVTPFEVYSQSSKGIYILPLRCIDGPIGVVKSYSAPSTKHYLACQPKHKWPRFFQQRMKDIRDGFTEIRDYHNPQWWNDARQAMDQDDLDPDSDSQDDEEPAESSV